MNKVFSHSVILFVGESKDNFFCNSRYFLFMLLTHAVGHLTSNCTEKVGNYFLTSDTFI